MCGARDGDVWETRRTRPVGLRGYGRKSVILHIIGFSAVNAKKDYEIKRFQNRTEFIFQLKFAERQSKTRKPFGLVASKI